MDNVQNCDSYINKPSAQKYRWYFIVEHESLELGPENDCSNEVQRQLQTRPLVREGATHQQTHNCLTVIKLWSWVPDGCQTPNQSGRLIIGRNTLSSI
jgi:hypothetical protein